MYWCLWRNNLKKHGIFVLSHCFGSAKLSKSSTNTLKTTTSVTFTKQLYLACNLGKNLNQILFNLTLFLILLKMSTPHMRDSLYIHILYHLLISSMLNMNGIAVNTVMEIELKNDNPSYQNPSLKWNHRR